MRRHDCVIAVENEETDGLVSEIRLLTRVTVAKAKSVVENSDEPADPERGGGFAEWAMLTLSQADPRVYQFSGRWPAAGDVCRESAASEQLAVSSLAIRGGAPPLAVIV